MWNIINAMNYIYRIANPISMEKCLEDDTDEMYY